MKPIGNENGEEKKDLMLSIETESETEPINDQQIMDCKKFKKKKKVKKEKSSKYGKSRKSIKLEEEERQRMERIRSENPGVAADFIFKTMLERDPRKRRIKPAVDRILENVGIDTSSDDSDFDPKNKKKGKGSKDTDDSDDDEDMDEDEDDGDDDTSQQDNDLSSDDEDYDVQMDNKKGSKRKKKDVPLAALFKDDSSMAESSSQDNVSQFNARRSQGIANILDPLVMEGPSTTIDRNKLMKVMVCAVCCGDVSYDSDEIIECDSCGISVHENCYGVTGSDTEDDVTMDNNISGRGSSFISDGHGPVDLTLNNTSSSGHHHHHQHNHRTTPQRTPPKAHSSPSKSTPGSGSSFKSAKSTPPSKTSPRKRQPSGHNEDNVSTASSASTEPWFCDPCKSGLDPSATNPSFDDSLICELCPNPGGIFKMTVTGRWVHVVCALYIPGVAFLDTNRLDGMTLFELPPERYGAKYCSLCPDDRLARTGVTITCDAGLCKTNFHVTCAQREGLLLEAQSLKETEMVDPFYAHCKIHSNPDKVDVKRKKKNFQSLMSKVKMLRSDLIQAANDGPPFGGINGQLPRTMGRMNERSWLKLQVSKDKWYKRRQQYAARYWRPQMKVPRSLATSSIAIRTLIKKTSYFGASLVHDVDEFEEQAVRKPDQGILLMKETLSRTFPNAPTESVFDLNLRKKMTSQPSFCPQFVNYYFDRDYRITEMSHKLSELKNTNDTLVRTETESRNSFEGVMKEYESIKVAAIRTRDKTRNVWNQLNRMLITHPIVVSPTSTPTKITLCSKKYYPKVLETPIKMSSIVSPVKPKATKLSHLSLLASNHHHGRSSSASSTIVSSNQPTVLNNCGKCGTTNDQHLLALCDKCHLHFHLYCLDPPLTRMPKKTRFGGWQCSDCTEAQVELEAAEIANGSLDRRIDGAKAVETVGSNNLAFDGEGRRLRKVPAKFATPEAGSSGQSPISPTIVEKRSKLKVGHSPTVPYAGPLVDDRGFTLTATGKKRGRPLGCKNGMGTKKKKEPKKKYKTKKAKVSNTGSEVDAIVGRADGSGDVKVVKVSKPKRIKKEQIDEDKECCKCKCSSSVKILVQCDHCLNYYHFTCLEPPLKKSPKARGYDWFCTDCDSSDEDDGKNDGNESSSGSSDSETDSSSSENSSDNSEQVSTEDDEDEK